MLRTTPFRAIILTLGLIVAGAFVAACGNDADEPDAGSTPVPQLSGSVLIDGSSTVFPITEAVAEEFSKVQRNVKVTVGVSGTGGGFQKFCNGETAIQDASRPISATRDRGLPGQGIEYIELPVAYDAPEQSWSTRRTTGPPASRSPS